MQNVGQLFECQKHINVSNYVFDPCMVLLASKDLLLVFCLWPSGAITQSRPSSHSSSLSAQLFSQQSFLGQIAWTSMATSPQIYWLTANLSIIHIPNYRLQPAGWRQQNKEGEKKRSRGKDMLSFLYTTTSPTGSTGFISPLCRAYQCSCSKSLFRVRCLITPTSLSVKYSTVTTGRWMNVEKPQPAKDEQIEVSLLTLQADNIYAQNVWRLRQSVYSFFIVGFRKSIKIAWRGPFMQFQMSRLFTVCLSSTFERGSEWDYIF